LFRNLTCGTGRYLEKLAAVKIQASGDLSKAGIGPSVSQDNGKISRGLGLLGRTLRLLIWKLSIKTKIS
jgi:hypothetical protein